MLRILVVAYSKGLAVNRLIVVPNENPDRSLITRIPTRISTSINNLK